MTHEIIEGSPDKIQDLRVEYVPIGSIKPYSRNARTHTKKQKHQLAMSILEFGFTNPILVDSQGLIIAGHGRLDAAKSLGLVTVPIITISYLNDKQKRALRLADNKIAENAGWDLEVLALELRTLVEFDAEFDLTITGHETAEIDFIMGPNVSELDPTLDRAPEINRAVQPISRPGDVWQLAQHRLLCGDATASDSFAKLMGGQIAHMIFIDPPYNVKIDGNVSGLGQITHREFVMAAGEMSEVEFIEFLSTVFSHVVRHSRDGAIHFVCMDWRHAGEVLTAARGIYDGYENLCVWNKTNGGMGSLYRSKHELVFVFKNGQAPHVNNVELGRFGRNRTNVWDYPGANAFGKERMDALAAHPTVKPVAMVADAILDCSNRNGIILDCFAGSGTTIIAADQVGRRAFAMELDPIYVDAAVCRWQDISGDNAIHTETGCSFSEIAKLRAASAENTMANEANGDEEVRNDQ